MIPYSPKAYNLLHDGTIALAQVEANGMRIDVDYLHKAIEKTGKRIERLEKRLLRTDVSKAWRKRYRSDTNFASTQQLGVVLFDVMGFESVALTKTGKPKTDETSLAAIDDPFIKSYLKIKKLQKAKGTYLEGILKHVTPEGLMHPVFNLGFTKTYRSSSDSPNFQNLPIRLDYMAKLIRSAIVAREGGRIVEIDYSGVEVYVALCYHKDPTMLSYILDPEKDMHRDMAMQCFRVPLHQMTKQIRYCGKNMFVFPQFYGSFWMQCAASLWEACTALDLKLADGTPMREHLASVGITKLGAQNAKEGPSKGSFEAHIAAVEKDFWENRFPVYANWKKRWYARYQKRGWFKTKTGFICRDYMRKNEAINYPVQGSAFHCLLQGLIWLQQEITRRCMKTKLIGQVHDSVVADVPDNELTDYLNLCQELFVLRLKERWKWLTIPLVIEAEVSPVNGSWYEKKDYGL